MSELLLNPKNRYRQLYLFSKNLIETGNAKAEYKQSQPLIDTLSAGETMQIIDQLILDDIPFEKIKANIGKLLNVFYKSLKSRQNFEPPLDSFFYFLMLENREVETIMSELKQNIKTLKQAEKPDYTTLKSQLLKLKDYELHYIKKENILFPYIEKTFSQYRCLQLMWSFHDDYRRLLKTLLAELDRPRPGKQEIFKLLGDLFFVVLPIIFREEYIVYPVAAEVIPASGQIEMLTQSNEIGWCYIDAPQAHVQAHTDTNRLIEGKVDLDTGLLSARQLILMLENLPVDITFVDENDEVCYFSGTKHRIFPRSKAIIGRKVQNCHPKESVHLVNEIVEAFKQGEKTHADFWIQMKGRFIHIRYFALRDENNQYKGTIEVSQDVTEIRLLEGEQRLLSWNRQS